MVYVRILTNIWREERLIFKEMKDIILKLTVGWGINGIFYLLEILIFLEYILCVKTYWKQ